MVICFNVDAGAKIALDNLLNTGQYRDASEAICVSLINHDIIQREAQHNGSVQINRTDLVNDSSSFVRGTRGELLSKPDERKTPRRIPDIFRLSTSSVSPDEFPAAKDNVGDKAKLTARDWLFGQYNKFLPVKATLRGLLYLSNADRRGVAVADAVRDISAEAQILGDYLEQLDEEVEASRENSLATAFPVTKGGGAASQSRFSNQFIVSINAEGTATGFPTALHLATVVEGKLPRLNLTRQGVQFAQLENPILDHGDRVAEKKFSDAEISFLIGHILRYVPQERHAFTIIMGALSDSLTTPKQLDELVFKEFSDPKMTVAFASLQRSGVISRLVDLQLVARVREGTRVTYALTESGAELLQGLSAQPSNS